jgi:LPXTG-site transpeptidase (sortase) family protein
MFKSLGIKQFLRIQLLLVLLAVGLIGYAGYQLWQRLAVTQGPSGVNTAETVTFSTNKPKESKVDNFDNYMVAANQPKVLRLPTINTEGLIQRVGVDQYHNIAVPTNLHVAGWYVNSVIPGNKGLSIIDGHVSGRYTTAIFKRLNQLQPSQQFSIEFGNGQRKIFEIISIKQVAEQDATKLLYQHNTALISELKLITCSGQFNTLNTSFTDRTIVTAKLLDSVD